MNELKKLKPYFDRVHQISLDSWKALEQILEVSIVEKGEVFCTEGDKYEKEVLVLKGLVRGYYNSFEKEEVNVHFVRDGSFLTPWMYRNKQGHSFMNLQALNTSELVTFHAGDFANLMNTYNDIQVFGRLVVEQILQEKINREMSILCKSALERYLEFQKIFPGLENEMAQYHVASYLGITPISLSRLRASI